MADGALAAPGLAELLRAHGLDPRILAYARELAELPPDLDEAGRRGLLHLALVLLDEGLVYRSGHALGSCVGGVAVGTRAAVGPGGAAGRVRGPRPREAIPNSPRRT